MSREKKAVSNDTPSILAAPPFGEQPTPSAENTAVSGPERLTDVDRLTLDLSKAKRQIALAEAKTALANNENAELNYKYLVLQIYMKYGLTVEDVISETGDIVRGGARQRNQ